MTRSEGDRKERGKTAPRKASAPENTHTRSPVDDGKPKAAPESSAERNRLQSGNRPAGRAAKTPPPEALRDEVLSAVRKAVSETTRRDRKSYSIPEFDLDFAKRPDTSSPPATDRDRKEDLKHGQEAPIPRAVPERPSRTTRIWPFISLAATTFAISALAFRYQPWHMIPGPQAEAQLATGNEFATADSNGLKSVAVTEPIPVELVVPTETRPDVPTTPATISPPSSRETTSTRSVDDKSDGAVTPLEVTVPAQNDTANTLTVARTSAPASEPAQQPDASTDTPHRQSLSPDSETEPSPIKQPGLDTRVSKSAANFRLGAKGPDRAPDIIVSAVVRQTPAEEPSKPRPRPAKSDKAPDFLSRAPVVPRQQRLAALPPTPRTSTTPAVRAPSSDTIKKTAPDTGKKQILSVEKRAQAAIEKGRKGDPLFVGKSLDRAVTRQAGRDYAEAAKLAGLKFAPLVAVLEKKSAIAARGIADHLLSEARKLLSKGKVKDARELLKMIAYANIAEVSLTLARSYDPTYFSTLPEHDAKPSVEQASNWYRRWHKEAVRTGQVSGGAYVERLIQAMQQYE